MEPGSSLLSHRSSALSSALSGFTSEVGMGSGGSRLLWPPGKLVGTSHRSLLLFGSSLGNVHGSVRVIHPHRLGVIWSSLTGN